MIDIIAFVLTISVLILGLFLTYYYKLQKKQVLFLKTLTSVCFIGIGITSYFYNKDSIGFFTLIFSGLICGLLGDISLGLKEIYHLEARSWFIIGICFFLTGHIFYIIAISQSLNSHYYLYIIMILIVMICGFAFSIKLHFDFGSLKGFIYVYLFASSVILVVSVLNAYYDPIRYKIAFAIGATLFIASDYVLSFLYFKKLKPDLKKVLKRINLSLYYIGQFLIALSIYFI
jgi:uncharacterized membrane protein YhhN